MKLGTVLSACNDKKKYTQWIPYFIKTWRKLFPHINIVIIFVGNKIPPILQKYKELILFNEIANIPTSYTAQFIRILYPSIISEEEGVLITDIDMIPLNKKYYDENIKNIDNDKFVYMRNVCMEQKQLAICYNIALPSVWREINKCYSLTDIKNNLVQTYKKDWFLDQKTLYKYVDKWDKRRFVILSDKEMGFKRLNLINQEQLSNEEKDNIKNGIYSDYHFTRPFKKYKELNNEVINCINKTDKTDNNFLFITGASSNHFRTLQQFLLSFKQHNHSKYPILVYDLGLKEEEVKKLKKEWNVIKFDYNQYPSWININVDAGHYAWKPIIIKEVSDMNLGRKIMWLDAGCKIIDNIDILVNTLKNIPIYSPKSQFRIRRLTHKKTIRIMRARELIMNSNRSGGICAFDLTVSWVKEIIGDWYKWALIKKCIAPEGSSRKNHRQDQSILSILFWRYHQEYQFPVLDKFIGFSAWNDIG